MRLGYWPASTAHCDDGMGASHRPTGIRPTRRHLNEDEDKVQARRTHCVGDECCDHHVVSAVIMWVEQSVAPERIIAPRFCGNTLTLSRPLYPYPAPSGLQQASLR